MFNLPGENDVGDIEHYPLPIQEGLLNCYIRGLPAEQIGGNKRRPGNVRVFLDRDPPQIHYGPALNRGTSEVGRMVKEEFEEANVEVEFRSGIEANGINILDY